MSILSRVLPSTLHTRLRDIVFGRSRIQVIDKSDSSATPVRPIFIIGCFRSGTTLLRYLIDSHSQICCPPETKFLTHLAALYENHESMKAFSSMGFEENYVRRRIRNLTNDFFLDYMAANGKSRWADKTPEYVRILDFIEWLYGKEVDYIFIYRNGLDVTHSMFEQSIQPLEPNKTLEKAFAYWAEDARIMVEWRSRLGARCHEVFYENLCRNPSKIMDGVFDFLEVPREDVVNNWYRMRHDMGYEDIKARRQTQIRVSHGNFKSWGGNVITHFKSMAAGLHEQIGYDPATLMPKESGGLDEI